MRLQKSATRVAAAGRNGDSMLMHVGPNEVNALSGLAALSGKSLTTNPKTGLPEAFSLGSVLQYALPVAAGMMFGPMGAAAASGLGTYAATGDANKALLSGAMGGAMGSMMGGLGGDTGTAASTAAQGATTDAATQGAANAAAQGAGQSIAPSAAIPGVQDYVSPAATGVPASASTSGISSLGAQSAPSTWSQKLDALQSPNTQWTGKNSVMQNADGSFKMAPIVAGGAALGLAGLQSNQDQMAAYNKQQQAEKDRMNKQFGYYQSMAGSMPANLIPAWQG